MTNMPPPPPPPPQRPWWIDPADIARWRAQRDADCAAIATDPTLRFHSAALVRLAETIAQRETARLNQFRRFIDLATARQCPDLPICQAEFALPRDLRDLLAVTGSKALIAAQGHLSVQVTAWYLALPEQTKDSLAWAMRLPHIAMELHIITPDRQVSLEDLAYTVGPRMADVIGDIIGVPNQAIADVLIFPTIGEPRHVVRMALSIDDQGVAS